MDDIDQLLPFEFQNKPLNINRSRRSSESYCSTGICTFPAAGSSPWAISPCYWHRI